jgi:hypothetical protein
MTKSAFYQEFPLLALYLLIRCMKKIIVFSSLIGAFAMTACSNNKTETKKEVITAPAPAATTPEKNTTIAVDKNGVKVTTKKVDVSLGDKK